MNQSERKYAVNRVHQEANKLISAKRAELYGKNVSPKTYIYNDIKDLLKAKKIHLVTQEEAIKLFSRSQCPYGMDFVVGLKELNDATHAEYKAKNAAIDAVFLAYQAKINKETLKFEDTIMLGGEKADFEACLERLTKIK